MKSEHDYESENSIFFHNALLLRKLIPGEFNLNNSRIVIYTIFYFLQKKGSRNQNGKILKHGVSG